MWTLLLKIHQQLTPTSKKTWKQQTVYSLFRSEINTFLSSNNKKFGKANYITGNLSVVLTAINELSIIIIWATDKTIIDRLITTIVSFTENLN